ncbi:MAG: hypothetical protein WA129_09785 [Acidovorax sp.]
MIASMQYLILQNSGEIMKHLLAELQGEEELFASANTLACVEMHLLRMAQTLAHWPEPLRLRLVQLDWHGWIRLQDLLEADGQPRREAVWYGIHALVPATLELIDRLRQQEPAWFELGY